MFSGHHFIILATKEEETDPFRELFSSTGGSSIVSYIDAGRPLFRRTLTKNSKETSLFVVTDDAVKATIPVAQWEELQEEAERLRFFCNNFVIT